MNLRDLFSISRWWGKIFGAFLGFLIAGPIGAIFGIFVGNFFDIGLTKHFSRPYWHYHAEKRKEIQHTFFKTTFLILGFVAKTDGRVTEHEIKTTLALMRDMQLNRQQKEEAKKYFNQGKRPGFNLSQTLMHLKTMCHSNKDLLHLFVDIQYHCAQTDGLSSAKIDALNHILKTLGFAPLNQQYRFYEDFSYHRSQQQRSGSDKSEQHEHAQHQYHSYQKTQPNSLERAFSILEISPSNQHSEVKQAYRRLMSRNHPDKLIAKGLPEEMIKMANEKTRQIRKAYEEICRYKGWPC